MLMMRFNAFVLAGAAFLLVAPTNAHAACTFLKPVGAEGPVVKKQVQRPKGLIGSAVGRTNWNTDFIVDQPYSSYKLFFTADSTDSTSYPIEAFLKFSDGSNLKVVDEALQPPLGTGRMFGPFAQVQGKSTTQVNFKVGANKDPKATGFSYRISVQGCR